MQRHAQHELTGFLRRLERRSKLNTNERKAILDLTGFREVIGHNGDVGRSDNIGDSATLILDGLLGRIEQQRDGNRHITAFHIAGDMADLASMVQPKTTYILQALSPTTVFRISRPHLRKLASDYPRVGEAFWRDSNVDASILAQWCVNLGYRDARGRVAHLLCEMAIRFGDAKHYASKYEFPLTQSLLAEATGLSVVHVNRTLQVLKAQVSMAGGIVNIRNWPELVQIADFDDSYLQMGQRSDAEICLT